MLTPEQNKEFHAEIRQRRSEKPRWLDCLPWRRLALALVVLGWLAGMIAVAVSK